MKSMTHLIKCVLQKAWLLIEIYAILIFVRQIGQNAYHLSKNKV